MPATSRGGVRVTGLTWTPFASQEPLLRSINLDISAGERVLLIGPSGSGKSTLLRAIAGVLTTTESGELLGQIETDSAGLLLQDPLDSLVSDTLFREVAFGLENKSMAPETMPQMVESELHAVGLAKPLSHSSTDLSGGEMQRMAFAGVLAMSPELLLLDEPTSMLDSAAAELVRLQVEHHLDAHQSTLIVVEHEFAPWLPLVNRILVLNGSGELVFDGEPSATLREPQLGALGLWLPDLDAPKLSAPDFGTKAGGTIQVLTGASGSGKTTELKRRLLADQNVKNLNVGYVPQQVELTIMGNTVFESAHVTAAKLAGNHRVDSKAAEEATRQLFVDLALDGLAEKNPYEISGGEQRRLALATALAHRPLALYLDEPTVGQDRDSWALIVSAILAARTAGMHLTIATHDRRLIELANVVELIEAPSGAVVSTESVNVSGLAVLASPMILLLGSMLITSTTSALVATGAVLGAAGLTAIAGFRLRNPRVLLPGLIAVISVGLSNWYLSVDQNPANGLISLARVSSFVLPGIVLASQLRPISLGDQFGQWLHLPARPVIAAVAAMQKLSNLIGTWDELRFIHRLRGFGLRGGPLARLQEWFRLVFSLLVQAIRTAGNTAVAMEARGFSSASMSRRTWAVKPKLERLDLLVVGLAVLVVATTLLCR